MHIVLWILGSTIVLAVGLTLRFILRYQYSKWKLSHIPFFNPACETSFPVFLVGAPNGLPMTVKSLQKQDGKGFEPIVRFGLGFDGKCTVLVCHPDGVREILLKDDIFAKDEGYEMLAEYLGDSIVTASGTNWKLQRRLLTPVFHFGALKKMIPEFADEARIMVERIKTHKGAPMDVCDLLADTTMSVIIRTGFGSEFDVDYMSGQWHVINQQMAAAMIPRMVFGKWARYLPTSWKFLNSVKNVEARCYEAIKRRRQAGNFESPDLLSLMLKAESEGSIGNITDEIIVGECIVFLLAGQDTTASTMDWCIYYLGLNKDIQKKLRDEVDSVLGKNMPTEADLSKLSYTKMVIEESLRIRSPVIMLSRKTSQDTELLGYKIPMGTSVRVGIGINSLNENQFDEPEKFDPERFSDKTSRHAYSYVPFSAGNRNCIGQKFAIQEALVLLSMLVQSFEIEVERDAQFTMKMEATLMPIGLKARFISRA